MHVGGVIAAVGALIFLAHFFSALFSRTRIPDVLLLTILGLVVGPLLHLITPASFGRVGPVFSTITLVLLLFEGGLDMHFDVLRKSLRGTVSLTLVNFAFTMAVVGGAGWGLAHFTLLQSATLGAIVGGTSPGVIIPLAGQLGLGKHASATLFLESALSDVLSIILTLALINAAELGTVRVGSVLGGLLASLLLASLLGAASALAWSLLINRVRNFEHTAFTTAAFLFLVYGLVEFLGFSGPVTALAFGATLGNVKLLSHRYLERFTLLVPAGLNRTERSFLGEILFLLRTFFFVYIGLSIELTNGRWLAWGVAVALLIYLARPAAVRLGGDRSLPRSDACRMAALAPKGLAAAVLASIPVEQGLPNGALTQSLVYAIILFTIVFATLLVFFQDRTALGRAYRWMFRSFAHDNKPLAQPLDLEATPRDA
ncbi:MAG TPA: cation:proton antiporter [Terriglobia bacterium]|nr:cation:proton antiporter [Terriglobia bacterium]